ncbi:monocarboxylate transporter 12-like isoform X2 [Wyeomyia smithii]|uniref:monocarboxylate transporter 12-like isoform X2 n=1 Tax=Wyeomyia smithii TaxID=174621 RepID=UPI0024680E93|nr:monocarboxylate transporter 12-like isoform X2 [Wyeomyia smithii]XP_055525950.1 monocarboxylate transporter 12-like isoform X2 [Wyeomyia smithii]XP_055525951.1 monocarboxylate transporter 12-like isoform X2 [Wyeomyia smithii]XP_055525952.1 monocarboxylate transporter 12-like isoform X2 [Wyeomyia smithii]XP_055525953.1 monocarboxylate transporter 12-like isoform X2 [Wyeomyia smithii]XP_055525955.1 monocarboxylate transporter 12-like isoform X2 [Wyeomyia smithii]
MRILFHSENYANYEDSGVATSADAHSLVFDEPNTPPPTTGGKCSTPTGPTALAAASVMGSAAAAGNRAASGVETVPSSTSALSPVPPGQTRASSRLSNTSTSTIKQHYYPEGGWGWIIVVVAIMVHVLTHGLHTAVGVIIIATGRRFRIESFIDTGWLGALSTAVALFISPITIAVCKRKSTRLTAVIGGLVTALGCLFTSFASQFHQLFFSYGAVVGVGVGMTRDCSTLMVAQYFKRRREFVEIFIVSGSGLGIAIMSTFIKCAIDAIGWRLGLQAVTGTVFVTFILGTCYRSASLYHPQRRAILHLKNQKRKIKDKNKHDDRPPFFDFSTLRSKTVRILLASTGMSAFGINTPIFYLAHQVEMDGIGDKVMILQTYLGLAWTLGCAAFGMLVVRNSVECRIARQYLCQTATLMCGLCILALTAVHGNYHGYVMFVWIYGIFCGGYHYSLKMYTYEKVRARNFARAWGFVQFSQAIPIALGVPISGYMNEGGSGNAGYYFSSACTVVGSLLMFLIDLHRRNVSRHKHTRANGTRHLCVSETCPQRRKLSFSQEPDNEPGIITGNTAMMIGPELLIPQLSDGAAEPVNGLDKPELTCISEEGIADMDLPDNLLDDLDYVGDCITSCNKVENYLMLSEYENNLSAEVPILLDKRGRRLSLSKTKALLANQLNIQHYPDCAALEQLNRANPPPPISPILEQTTPPLEKEHHNNRKNHHHGHHQHQHHHHHSQQHHPDGTSGSEPDGAAKTNPKSDNLNNGGKPCRLNHKWRPTQQTGTFLSNRVISVIDEASV